MGRRDIKHIMIILVFYINRQLTLLRVTAYFITLIHLLCQSKFLPGKISARTAVEFAPYPTLVRART